MSSAVYQKKVQELEQRNKELEKKVEKQGNKNEHMNEAKVPKSSSIQKLIGTLPYFMILSVSSNSNYYSLA